MFNPTLSSGSVFLSSISSSTGIQLYDVEKDTYSSSEDHSEVAEFSDHDADEGSGIFMQTTSASGRRISLHRDPADTPVSVSCDNICHLPCLDERDSATSRSCLEIRVLLSSGSRYVLYIELDEIKSLHKQLAREIESLYPDARGERPILPPFPKKYRSSKRTNEANIAYTNSLIKAVFASDALRACGAVQRFLEYSHDDANKDILTVQICRANGLRHTHRRKFKGSNPRCDIYLTDINRRRVGVVHSTATKHNTQDPVYNETFVFHITQRHAGVTIELWDGKYFMGTTSFAIANIPYNRAFLRALRLHSKPEYPTPRSIRGTVALEISMQTPKSGGPSLPDEVELDDEAQIMEAKQREQKRRLVKQMSREAYKLRGIGKIAVTYKYVPPGFLSEGRFDVEIRMAKFTKDDAIKHNRFFVVVNLQHLTKKTSSSSTLVWHQSLSFSLPPDHVWDNAKILLYGRGNRKHSTTLLGTAEVVVQNCEPDEEYKEHLPLIAPARTTDDFDKNLGLSMREEGWRPFLPIILVPGFGSTGLRCMESAHNSSWENERVWISLRKLVNERMRFALVSKRKGGGSHADRRSSRSEASSRRSESTTTMTTSNTDEPPFPGTRVHDEASFETFLSSILGNREDVDDQDGDDHGDDDDGEDSGRSVLHNSNLGALTDNQAAALYEWTGAKNNSSLFSDTHRVEGNVYIGNEKEEYSKDFVNRFLQHMSLAEDLKSDPPGIKLRAIPGRSGCAYLAPGMLTNNLSYVMGPLIENLIDLGYEMGYDLEAEGYDWRLAPFDLEARDGYYTKLAHLVRKMARRTHKKVVLMGHSMGCRTIQYFLWFLKDHAEYGQSFIDRYIHTFAPVGPPFLGSSKMCRGLISGDRFGMDQLLDEKEAFRFGGTLGSAGFLLPIGRDYDNPACENSIMFIRSPETGKWVPEDWEKIAVDAGSHRTIHQFNHAYLDDPTIGGPSKTDNRLLKAPPIKRIWCIYGVNLETEFTYFYKDKDGEKDSTMRTLDPSADDEVTHDGFVIRQGIGYETSRTPQPLLSHLPGPARRRSGDGTVPYCSLRYCEKWKKDVPQLQIHELDGVDHREIMGNRHFFFKLISYIGRQLVAADDEDDMGDGDVDQFTSSAFLTIGDEGGVSIGDAHHGDDKHVEDHRDVEVSFDDPLMVGKLRKRGPPRYRTTKRWFVLPRDADALYYFNMDDGDKVHPVASGKKPRGKIRLSQGTLVRRPQPEGEGVEHDGEQHRHSGDAFMRKLMKRGFLIQCQGGTEYQLCASSIEERDSWVNHLNDVLEANKPSKREEALLQRCSELKHKLAQALKENQVLRAELDALKRTEDDSDTSAMIVNVDDDDDEESLEPENDDESSVDG